MLALPWMRLELPGWGRVGILVDALWAVGNTTLALRGSILQLRSRGNEQKLE